MQRFPFYKQLDAMDCGPTCLRMIVRYCGRLCSAAEGLMKKILLTGISLLTIISASAQELKLGLREISYDKGYAVLDQASMGIVFSYRQKAVKEGKSIELSDTVLVALGDSYSLSCCPSYASRETARTKSNLAGSRQAPMAILSEDSLEQILEFRASGTGYQEFDSGDPVFTYKKYKEKSIISVLQKRPEMRTEQSMNDFMAWSIGQDTQTILGHPCIKASLDYAGRHYTAWFSMDIPVSDGPGKFCGLPGMILKVQDDEGVFSYEAIGIENYGPDQVKIVISEGDYEKATIKQFNQQAAKARSVQSSAFMGGSFYILTEQPYTFNTLEK